MSLENAQNDLLVLEYGGTGRSGKGTIVGHLAETYKGVATEETGADYRAVTRYLLTDNVIEQGMNPESLERQVLAVGEGALSSMVAGRNELVEEVGLASLYLPDVADLVGHISPLGVVRQAVKAGFKKRVEAVRDSGDYQVLLVDGRNLAPVIEQVKKTRLLMRTFLSCVEVEAAIRECTRKGLKPRTTAWDSALDAAYQSISTRNELDAERGIDPVRPDPNAVDYWWDNEAMRSSARLSGTENGLRLDSEYDESVSFMDWLTEKVHHKRQLRRGVGSIACRDNRQVHFETAVYRGHYDDPLGGMLAAARTMFEEAVGLHPRTDSVVNRMTSDLPQLKLI
jgi:cytidylate kinase